MNGELFDRFTIGHFLVGYFLGHAFRLPTVSLVAVGWELVERPWKEAMPHLFPHPSQDSPLNMAGDIGAMILGGYLAQSGK